MAAEQAGTGLSRRVLLVKNLRAGTTAAELEARVAEAARLAPASDRDGAQAGRPTRPWTLLRLILPPHGLTAIAEFASASEARKAFRALSYASVSILYFRPFTCYEYILMTVLSECEREREFHKIV